MEATAASRTSQHPPAKSEFAIGRLFLADSAFAFLAFNQARYLALTRLGVSREQANLVTVVLALIAADAAHKRAQRIGRPSLPVSDAVMAASAMREAALRVAGPSARDVPLFGTLVVVALIWGSALPGFRRAARALRDAEQRARVERIRRYASL